MLLADKEDYDSGEVSCSSCSSYNTIVGWNDPVDDDDDEDDDDA